ncbi:MAG: STAS/SEC14 domain-containing protein [Planctomycetes bacterium]|nr:STAS/SEC14 domain-containing protein [Planctomycetota bacterium]
MRNLRETLRFSQKKSINKILFDMREQKSLASTMDIHDFAATLPEATHGYKVAIVCTPRDTDAKYIETVAKNRGAFIKVFHCFDEALDWLAPRDRHTSNKPPINPV